MILKTEKRKYAFHSTLELFNGSNILATYVGDFFFDCTIKCGTKLYNCYRDNLFWGGFSMDFEDSTIATAKKSLKGYQIQFDNQNYEFYRSELSLNNQSMGSVYSSEHEESILFPDYIFTVNFKDEVPLELHLFCLFLFYRTFRQRDGAA